MNSTIGRYCDIHGLTPVDDLRAGMDFRKPEYRREVFLRFYEFHLKYRAHPGGVYYLFPYIAKRQNYDMEQKLWFAFVNGCTQNPITTSVIMEHFPTYRGIKKEDLRRFFDDNWARIEFDSDRKYVKTKFPEMVMNYKELVGSKGQEAFFNRFASGDDVYTNFNKLWSVIINNYADFGRLSTFSYMEYLRIMGVNIDCSSLFLDDINGSKSHRNGLCRVLGRDDMDWHDTITPDFKGYYTREELDWLKMEGELLLGEAKERMKGKDYEHDVSYFTLESTLCCYKSWSRPNRRYPNVYNDMMYNRIKKGEHFWERKFEMFWEARRECLPEFLRLEDNKGDY